MKMNENRRAASYNRVWFITGSSDGIGRALTEAVLARGERAVVTTRKPERVRDLIDRAGLDRFRTVPKDR